MLLDQNLHAQLRNETLQQMSMGSSGIHQPPQSQNLINQSQAVFQQGNNGGLHIEIPTHIKSLSFNSTGNSCNGQIPQLGMNNL